MSERHAGWLRCPYCGGELWPIHQYVGAYLGGDVFTGFECLDCLSDWDEDGRPNYMGVPSGQAPNP